MHLYLIVPCVFYSHSFRLPTVYRDGSSLPRERASRTISRASHTHTQTHTLSLSRISRVSVVILIIVTEKYAAYKNLRA